MEINILMNEGEFIIASVIPPIVAGLYYGIKFYLKYKNSVV